MSYFNRLLVVTFAILFLLGCSKELSVETGGTGGNSGGNPLTDFGWVFTGKAAQNYRGCIDTAFYQAVGAFKSLYIDGIDSAGNAFTIILVSQSGSITPGTYNISQGATMSVTDQNGNTFFSKSPAPFSLQLTNVNDTLVEGNFSGTLTNTGDSTTFNLSNGKLKALIGKRNPCSGGGSTPVRDAAFLLVNTGATCSNAIIKGGYFKGVDLENSNTVKLDVNVTSPGNWQITTPTVNGMVFSGSGTFTTAGSSSILLSGSGKPANSGNHVFPLQAGSSTCSFTIRVDSVKVAVPGTGDYFPMTRNNNWTYHVEQTSSGLSDSTDVLSTGSTVRIGTQTYNILAGDLLGSVYRKANGVYYRYGSIDYFDLIDSSHKAETIFLRDTVTVSQRWESAVMTTTLGTNTVKFKRVFTVLAKNVSVTVNGVIYNNVITMSEVLMADIDASGFQPYEETVFDYAKGIGLIQAVNVEYELDVDLLRFQVF